MRILHIGSSYRPYLGGNATRVSTLLEHYSHPDIELFVVTVDHPDGAEFDALYLEETGIHILRIPTHNLLWRILPALVRDFHIDVVHAHNFQALLCAALRLPRNVCLIDEIHTILDSTTLRRSLRQHLYRLWLSRRVARFFCLSNNANGYLTSHYKIPREKIVVTVNGRKPFRGLQSRINLQQRIFTYGYVGTFYSWQGIDVLLEYAEDILSIAEDVRIVAVGDGPAYPKARQYVEQHRLESRVCLPGMVSKDELSRWYEQIDVFLMPRPSTVATEHSIPLKIFDAIAEGIPIVMSNVHGLTEVLDETAALIFDAAQPHEFVNKCRAIYRNYQLMDKLVHHAYHRGLQFPTWGQVAELQQESILSVMQCQR